jgi:hypothetical protein
LYEKLRSKKSVLEYEAVTVDTAEEGMRVVLLAGGNREEVGRGIIIKPPVIGRQRQVWEPAYGMTLGEEEKAGWITHRLTCSRLVVAVNIAKAPCATLPYLIDPAVSTITQAAEQGDKEGGNQVLWDLSRVRRVPDRKRGGEGGGGGSGEGGGGGEEVEGSDDTVSVSSRAATPADEDDFEDNWEDGLERDREVAQALWEGVPERESEDGGDEGEGKARLNF